ncbi:MAG: hypothetical protein HRT45_19210 [Bdellovibrionales bacterium]|nr:hypothetical protein [Bdellovibrionales bacterium]
MKALKLVAVGLAILFLAGCGLRTVIVPNLDWILGLRVNKVLDLEGKQKDQLYKDISTILEQLKPNASRIQNRMKKLKLSELSPEQEQAFIESAYESALKVILPYYANYLSRFSDQQVENLKQSNQDSNQKILEEIRQANEKNEELYTRLLGPLTAEQKQLVKSSAGDFVNSRVDRLKRRKDYQKKLYKIFNNKDQDFRKQQILEITLNYTKVSKQSESREVFVRNFTRVSMLSNPNQQQHFGEKIKEYSLWLETFLDTDFR